MVDSHAAGFELYLLFWIVGLDPAMTERDNYVSILYWFV
jgi:hypothetical protein